MRAAPTLLALCLSAAAPCSAQDPTRVLVIYNASWPDENGNGIGDSLEVAQHYMARRGVPAQNLLGCNCSSGGGYFYWQLPGWTAFYDEVRTPVVNKLAQLGSNSIDVLLFCYGVPYHLELGYAVDPARSLDDCMKTPFQLGTRTAPQLVNYVNPYHEQSPGIGTDHGPFHHGYSSGGQPIWMTARLDGWDAYSAKELVEGALYAERHLSLQPGHYRGYGYVDTRYKQYGDQELLAGYPFGYGSYQSADASMAVAKLFVQAAGFPLKWENTALDLEIGELGATFHDLTPAQSAPAALFYGGWYNYGRYFDVWSWLPGSCAVDLNSNSLQGVRIPYQGAFVSQALQRGLSCGVGCIAEPYLNLHPQPEKFLYFLLKGYSFAEAAMLSMPALSWVNLAVGDPLYGPLRAGRQVVIDTTPPPQPGLQAALASPTDVQVIAQIDVAAREPDLVTMRVDYGATSSYGQVADHGNVYRTRQTTKLAGLVPDRLYHARSTLRDPAGNTTTTPDFVFYTKAFAPALAALSPKAQTVPVPQPAPLDLVVGHQAGFWNLTGLQVLLSAPHLAIVDVDVTLPVLQLPGVVSLGAANQLIDLQVAFPGTLPRGTYTLKLRVFAGAAAPVEDVATITLQ